MLRTLDEEQVEVLGENEQLHMTLQEVTEANNMLRREMQQYTPERTVNRTLRFSAR